MKKAVAAILFLAVAGGVVWSYRPGLAQQAGPPAPLKIAVANVTKVLSECKENLDRQKLMAEKEQLLSKELNRLRTEAEAIKAELEANVFKPGSKEYQAQMMKWVEKNYLMEAFQEGQKRALEAETQAWMEALYEKLIEEVAKIAQQEGITLVLQDDKTDEKMPNLSAMMNLIRSRRVIYRTANIDITDRVLKSLDAGYVR